MNLEQRCAEKRLSILQTPTKVEVKGKAYFVSLRGDDSSSGDENNPWRTLNRVDSADLQEGDCVFFHRGDVFRGQLRVKNGVTYSAYGIGNKPCIYGSPDGGNNPKNWERVSFGENIWKYKIPLVDVGTVIFDGGEIFAEKVLAYYSNGNFIPYGSDKPFFTDKQGDIADKGLTQDEYFIADSLEGDLKFFCHCKGNNEANGFPTRKTEGYLYLRCDNGNPAEVFRSVEFNTVLNVIEGAFCQNVTIDNLCVKYGGGHGIGAGHVKNLTVQNCEIAWIGGGILYYSPQGQPTRYGNGVEVYGSCDGFTVENCLIYQCYDTGITHQQGGGGCDYYMDNITYQGNLVEDCYWNIEYYLYKADDPKYTVRLMRNVVIKDNILRRAGYGFGTLRPNLGAAANIMGWWKDSDGENIYVINNILDRSIDFMVNASTENEKAVPKMSGNCYIQTEGRYFGRMGVNLPQPARGSDDYMNSMQIFGDSIEDYIKNVLGDKTAKIYKL